MISPAIVAQDYVIQLGYDERGDHEWPFGRLQGVAEIRMPILVGIHSDDQTAAVEN